MNKKVVGETLNDMVSSITESKWAKSIIPTVDELNQTMVNNVSSSKRYLDSQAAIGGAHALQNFGGLSEDKAKAIAKNISSKDIDASIDAMRDKIAEAIPEDKDINKVMAAMKKKAASSVNAKPDVDNVIEEMKGIEKYAHYPKAYFTNPDKTIQKYRIGTAIGAYAGVAIGGRYLSGGTLTTDSYGRKDIAGIPFL